MYGRIIFLCLIAYAVAQVEFLNVRPPKIPTPLTDQCLNCLCQADSGCKPSANCTEEPDRWGGGVACGYYKLTLAYYRACASPGRQHQELEDEAYQRCANDKACADECVQSWLKKFELKRCDPAGAKGEISPCENFARNHFGGPTGCWKNANDNYWLRVSQCMASSGK